MTRSKAHNNQNELQADSFHALESSSDTTPVGMAPIHVVFIVLDFQDTPVAECRFTKGLASYVGQPTRRWQETRAENHQRSMQTWARKDTTHCHALQSTVVHSQVAVRGKSCAEDELHQHKQTPTRQFQEIEKFTAAKTPPPSSGMSSKSPLGRRNARGTSPILRRISCTHEHKVQRAIGSVWLRLCKQKTAAVACKQKQDQDYATTKTNIPRQPYPNKTGVIGGWEGA